MAVLIAAISMARIRVLSPQYKQERDDHSSLGTPGLRENFIPRAQQPSCQEVTSPSREWFSSSMHGGIWNPKSAWDWASQLPLPSN